MFIGDGLGEVCANPESFGGKRGNNGYFPMWWVAPVNYPHKGVFGMAGTDEPTLRKIDKKIVISFGYSFDK